MIRITECVVIFVVVFFIALFLLSGKVLSHSWYDHYCCNDRDCSEVLSKENTGHGSWIIHSKNGMVLIPYDFPKLPSQDDKEHICMYFDGVRLVPRCYYVPAGM